MSVLSYSDVFSLVLDSPQAHDVDVGDLVCTGMNNYPRFTVVAVSGDKAWLRNADTGVDSLAMRVRCRRISGDALAMAAE